MNVSEAVARRQSVRAFKAAPVAKETLRAIWTPRVARPPAVICNQEAHPLNQFRTDRVPVEEFAELLGFR